MAYKNSQATSSVAQQIGTWRHFTSSLGKLGTLKTGSVSIKPPSMAELMDNGYAINSVIQKLGTSASQKLEKWNKAYEANQLAALKEQRAQASQQRAQEKHAYWQATREYQYATTVANAQKAVIGAREAEENIPVNRAKREAELKKYKTQVQLSDLKEQAERAGYYKKILQGKAYAADYPLERQKTQLELLAKQQAVNKEQKKKFLNEAEALIARDGIPAYLQAVKGIPFSQNPVAKAAYIQAGGKAIFGTAKADFQADIDAGKYLGVPVQEALSQFKKQLGQGVQQLSGAFGVQPDDPDLIAAVYGDTLTDVIAVRQRLLESDNTDKSSKASSVSLAEVATVIQNGGDADAIYTSTLRGLLAITKDSDRNKFISGVVDSIVNSQNGHQLLTAFLQKEDPLLSGFTLGSRLSKVSLAQLQTKANNTFISSNAGAFSALYVGLSKVAQQGNVEQLQNLKANVLLNNGGVEDDYTSKIDSFIKKAQSVKAANIIKEQKKTEQNLKKTATQAYIQDLIGGSYLKPPSEYGTNNQLVNTTFNSMVQSGEITPQQIVSAAGNLTPNNPARTWVNGFASNILNNLNTQLQAYATNKGYQFKQPQGFNTLLAMWKKNPSVFGNSSGYLRDKQTLLLNSMAWMLDLNKFSFHQLMRSRVLFQEKIDKKPKFLDDLEKSCIKNLKDSDFDGGDYGYAEAFVLNTALASMELGVATSDTAIRYGISKFKEDHVNVFAGWIPKHFLSFDPNLQPQIVGEFASNLLQERLSAFSKLDPSKDVYIITQDDGIHVRNRYTALQLFKITQDELKQYTEGYKEKVVEDIYKQRGLSE